MFEFSAAASGDPVTADDHREDFETVQEHLDRIGCEFKSFEDAADGVWEGELHE